MSKKEKVVMFILGGLITYFIMYMAVRQGVKDTALFIVPGWHTTILSPEITWAILTSIILVTSMLVYVVFRGTIKLLTSLWTNMNKQ